MSEKCVRIRYAFQKAVGSEIARKYYITGGRGEARKIDLDRSLVVREKRSPPS